MANFRDDRSADGVSAAAFCGRVASGEAFGAVHCRSYRRSRPGPAERGLPRFGVGFVSSPDVAGPVGLRVRDGDILQPEAQAGDRPPLVAFRFIAANDHPDHDTIAAFRRRFLKEIEELFVEVLQLAREMGVLKMGIIGLDGTKNHANASRHSALSYEHVGRIEAQLKAEVADLLARAEAADAADVPYGMSISDELARREERLRKLAEAKAKIEARAKERHAREMAEHQAKMASREAKTAATGKKPGGKPPAPPTEGPLPINQVNLTDAELRIMPVAGGGFDQCYNAQAAVAAGSLLVVAVDVVQQVAQ